MTLSPFQQTLARFEGAIERNKAAGINVDSAPWHTIKEKGQFRHSSYVVLPKYDMNVDVKESTSSKLIFSPAKTQESSPATLGSIPATSGNPQPCEYIPSDGKCTKGAIKAPGIQASVDMNQSLLKFEHAMFINVDNATKSPSIHAATLILRHSKRVPGTIGAKENELKSNNSSSRSCCQAKITTNSHITALSSQPKHCRSKPRCGQNLHSHMAHLQLPKIPSRKPELLLSTHNSTIHVISYSTKINKRVKSASEVASDSDAEISESLTDWNDNSESFEGGYSSWSPLMPSYDEQFRMARARLRQGRNEPVVIDSFESIRDRTKAFGLSSVLREN